MVCFLAFITGNRGNGGVPLPQEAEVEKPVCVAWCVVMDCAGSREPGARCCSVIACPLRQGNVIIQHQKKNKFMAKVEQIEPFNLLSALEV